MAEVNRDLENFFVNAMGEIGYSDDDLVTEDELGIDEQELLSKWEAVSRLGTSLFRFRVHTQRLWLETEFYGYRDDPEVWIAVLDFLSNTEYARLWILDEGKEVDRWKQEGDTEWRIGPNDGRQFRQVSIDQDITDKTPNEVEHIIENWRKAIMDNPKLAEARVDVL